jgi:AcrR family transcriptional regulator
LAELIDIIEKAEQLFFKYGIKSISMDDLSREMSISKKTLYVFVDNKEELVYLVVQNHIHREKKKVEEVIKNSKNSIDEFLQIIMHNHDELNTLNPSVIYDLQKYHPKSWSLFTEFTEFTDIVSVCNKLRETLSPFIGFPYPCSSSFL